MIIALDGPSGSGKSTAAKILAKKLNISYLDTGAMYRGIAYYILSQNIELNDLQSIINILPQIKMQIVSKDTEQHVIINNEDVTPFIRENRISMAASTVSKIPEVRIKLVELQREIANENDCVLDGRDIGSYVLPNADYKFYITADSIVRAKRRQEELQKKGEHFSLEEIKNEIEKRDEQDKNRKFAPLVICDDAIVIDTTLLTIEEVISLIMNKICK